MVLFLLQRSDGIRPALNSPMERPNGDQEEGEASVQVRSAPWGESVSPWEQSCSACQWSSALPLMFLRPRAAVAERALCHIVPGLQVNTSSCAHSMACISTWGLWPAPWALPSGPGGEQSHAVPRPALYLELER